MKTKSVLLASVLFFLLISQQNISADTYCNFPITSSNSKTAYITCTQPTSGTYVMTITSDDNSFSGLIGAGNYVYLNGENTGQGTQLTSESSHVNFDNSTKTLTITLSSSAAPVFYNPLYLNFGGEQAFTDIQNKSFEWPAECGAEDGGCDGKVVYFLNKDYNDGKWGDTYAYLWKNDANPTDENAVWPGVKIGDGTGNKRTITFSGDNNVDVLKYSFDDSKEWDRAIFISKHSWVDNGETKWEVENYNRNYNRTVDVPFVSGHVYRAMYTDQCFENCDQGDDQKHYQRGYEDLTPESVWIGSDNNGWNWTKDAANTFNIGCDYISTITIPITDNSFKFKIVEGSTWYSISNASETKNTSFSNVAFTYTGSEQENNVILQTTIHGEYVFTYNYINNFLSVTYPELPVMSSASHVSSTTTTVTLAVSSERGTSYYVEYSGGGYW